MCVASALQRDLADFAMQLALVGTRPGILAGFRAFVPLSPAQAVLRSVSLLPCCEPLSPGCSWHPPFVDLDYLAELRHFLRCFSLVVGLNRLCLRPSSGPLFYPPDEKCEKHRTLSRCVFVRQSYLFLPEAHKTRR